MSNAMPCGNTAALRQYEREMDLADSRLEEFDRRIVEYEADPDFSEVREALQRDPDRLDDLLFTIWFAADGNYSLAMRKCKERIRWAIHEIVRAAEEEEEKS